MKPNKTPKLDQFLKKFKKEKTAMKQTETPKLYQFPQKPQKEKPK